MNSPFPGMDPYLENRQLWSSFHNGLAYEIQAQLNSQFQPKYFARLTPYVTYQLIEIGEPGGIYPDVGVWQPQPPVGEVAVAAPVITPAPVESTIALEMPLRTHSVEIHRADTQELVTVIEILSPVNKRPGHPAYKDYHRKRRNLLQAEVHLLEIDLLRGGERPPLARPVPPAPYYVNLYRSTRYPKVEVWPIQLADPLPVLPTPLLPPDPDVPLDLGAAVRNVYERGAYASQLDYRQPPPPPELAEAEVAWVEALLGETGRR